MRPQNDRQPLVLLAERAVDRDEHRLWDLGVTRHDIVKALNRGGGWTTGTISPGVLWEGKYFQIGAEAVIPINKVTGNNIGGVFNVQVFIDDLEVPEADRMTQRHREEASTLTRMRPGASV